MPEIIISDSNGSDKVFFHKSFIVSSDTTTTIDYIIVDDNIVLYDYAKKIGINVCVVNNRTLFIGGSVVCTATMLLPDDHQLNLTATLQNSEFGNGYMYASFTVDLLYNIPMFNLFFSIAFSFTAADVKPIFASPNTYFNTTVYNIVNV